MSVTVPARQDTRGETGGDSQTFDLTYGETKANIQRRAPRCHARQEQQCPLPPSRRAHPLWPAEAIFSTHCSATGVIPRFVPNRKKSFVRSRADGTNKSKSAALKPKIAALNSCQVGKGLAPAEPFVRSGPRTQARGSVLTISFPDIEGIELSDARLRC